MLYKRYGNPIDLLATFSLEGLSDFIFYLFDQENEDTLFEVWLHKDQENDYATFKKNNSRKSFVKQPKKLNEKEEKAIIEDAMKLITPRNERR